jgi:hypothetical protein
LQKLNNLSDEAKKNLLGYGGVFIGIPLLIFLSTQTILSNNKILGIFGLLILLIPLGYVIALIFHFLIMLQLGFYQKANNKFSGITAFLIAYIPFVILFILLFIFEPAFVDLISL